MLHIAVSTCQRVQGVQTLQDATHGGQNHSRHYSTSVANRNILLRSPCGSNRSVWFCFPLIRKSLLCGTVQILINFQHFHSAVFRVTVQFGRRVPIACMWVSIWVWQKGVLSMECDVQSHIGMLWGKNYGNWSTMKVQLRPMQVATGLYGFRTQRLPDLQSVCTWIW